LRSLGFSESQIPPWISRVNIPREGEAPIVRGEPIEEEPPSPLERPSPPPQAPPPLRGPIVDTRRPLGDLPVGQAAREPKGGRGGAPKAPEVPVGLEGLEGGLERTEEGLENFYEREARFNGQLRDQGIFEPMDGY
jgi:hypothetical protein